MKFYTCIQLEAILRIAFNIKGNSLKDVAEMTGNNRNILYKWNSGAMRFSPENMDRLILYFMEHEHMRLDSAVKIFDALQGID